MSDEVNTQSSRHLEAIAEHMEARRRPAGG